MFTSATQQHTTHPSLQMKPSNTHERTRMCKEYIQTPQFDIVMKLKYNLHIFPFYLIVQPLPKSIHFYLNPT
jgi:hypothetical protein